MVMDDQISFVLAETVAGNREKEVCIYVYFICLYNNMVLYRRNMLDLVKKRREEWTYNR